MKNTSNFQWSDGTTEVKTVPWTIGKANGYVTLDDNKSVRYGTTSTTFEIKSNHGGTLGVSDNNATAGCSRSGNTVTISNISTLATGTQVKVTVTCAETTNYKSASAEFILTIGKESIYIPSQSGTLTYNTNSQSPSWNSYYNSSLMTLGGTTSGTNAGSYNATFTLKDTTNYQWSDGTTAAKTVAWTIGKYDLSNANMTQSAMEYTGTQLKPEPTVTVNIPSSSNKTTLSKGTHFTYSYGANVNAGTNAGSVTITAVANTNYTGTKTVSFNITSKKLTVPAQSGSLTYNAASQSPIWNSNYDSSKMTLGGTTSGTNADSYQATFALKDTSNYSWSDGTTTAKNVTWSIGKYNLSNANMTQSALEYTGSQLKPTPAVTVSIPSGSTTTLTSGTHFTYSYGDNVNAGTNVGSVTITAVANTNYTGSKTVNFNITAKKLNIPAQSGTLTYNAASQSPTWNSNYDSGKMTLGGTTSGTNATSYNATFTLKSTTNYQWSDGTTAAKTVAWSIGKYNLSNASMSQSALNYTGSQLKPEPTVTVPIPSGSTTTLSKGTHFTYSYGDNVNAGTNAGSVTINAVANSNYTGTKTINFTINAISPTFNLGSQNGTLKYNTEGSFTGTANMAGTLQVTSGNTTYVTVTSGNGASVAANTATTIKVKGVKVTGNATTITVKFTPTDTNYTSVTKTYSVTNVYYQVTYVKEDEDIIDTIGSTSTTSTSGSITLPSITVYDGYYVDGWYNGNTKVGNAGATVTINNNVTLTAKAKGNSYTVNYYNAGTKVGSSNHIVGTNSNLKMASALGMSYYDSTFVGWSDDENSVYANFGDGAVVDGWDWTPDNGEEVNLYAVWKGTAIFSSRDSNGDDNERTSDYYIIDTGDGCATRIVSIPTPDVIAGPGWSAVGYSSVGPAGITINQTSGAYSCITSIRPNTYFNAMYERTITFYSGKKTISATNKEEYNVPGNSGYDNYQYTNNTAPLTANSVSGFSFVGWSASQDGSKVEIQPGGEIGYTNVYYAVYSRLAYFYSGLKTDNYYVTATQYYNSSDNYYCMVPDESQMRTMGNGWSIDNSHECMEYESDSSSIGNSWYYGEPSTSLANHYYAQYKRNVTVSYNKNGGTGTMSSSSCEQSYISNGTLTGYVILKNNAFTKTGYYFSDWLEDSSTADDYYDEGDTYTRPANKSASAIMYADWSPNRVTINYYKGNTQIGSSVHTYGVTSYLKDIDDFDNADDLLGWSFYGWTTSQTSTDRSYANGAITTSITQNRNGTMDLYAIYRRTAYFYYGLEEDDEYETSTQYYNPYIPSGSSKGTYYCLVPDESDMGTMGNGWSLDSNHECMEYESDPDPLGTSWYYGEPSTSSANHYYAQYKRTVTVSYNNNGGTGTMSSSSYEQRYISNGTLTGSVILKDNAFTKSGYHFDYWLEGSTSGDDFNPGNNYTRDPGLSNTVSMFASWSANRVIVNYYKGSTLLGTSTHTYGDGSTLKASSSFTNIGLSGDWQFAGWAISDSSADIKYGNSAATSGITLQNNGTFKLYAVYKRDAYMISGLRMAGGTSTDIESQYYNPAGTSGSYKFELYEMDDVMSVSGYEMLDECMSWDSESTGWSYFWGDVVTSSDRHFYAQYKKNGVTYNSRDN